jgi:hypothetical protein
MGEGVEVQSKVPSGECVMHCAGELEHRTLNIERSTLNPHRFMGSDLLLFELLRGHEPSWPA